MVWQLRTTAQVRRPHLHNLLISLQLSIDVLCLFVATHPPLCVARTDSILWKLFYVAGCLFVAMQNMEEWEEAVFDKTKNLIELKSFSLYTLVLTLWRKGQEKGQYHRRLALLSAVAFAGLFF